MLRIIHICPLFSLRAPLEHVGSLTVTTFPPFYGRGRLLVSPIFIGYLSLGPRKGQTPDPLWVVLFQGITNNINILYHFVQFGSHASRSPQNRRNVTEVTVILVGCRVPLVITDKNRNIFRPAA